MFDLIQNIINHVHYVEDLDDLLQNYDVLKELDKKLFYAKIFVAGRIINKMKNQGVEKIDFETNNQKKNATIQKGRSFLRKSPEQTIDDIKNNLAYSDDQLVRNLFDQLPDTLKIEVKK